MSTEAGAIHYPSIALWAALIGDTETYSKVSAIKREQLQHCTFQFWYPDDASEVHFYTDSNPHGATLANLAIDRPKEEFLAQAFGECEHSSHFRDLSAVKTAWWPLIVIACRHYRLPLPLHFLEEIYKPLASQAKDGTRNG